MPDVIRVTCPKCAAEWDSADRPGSVVTCSGCGTPVRVQYPTVVPTGERGRCPTCGADNSVPLGDKAIDAFYAAYKQTKSPFLLYRPRKCQECGQRWEVNPPRWALVCGSAVLGVGLVVCLALTALCAWSAVGGGETADYVGWGLAAFGGAVGCGYGLRHYLRKLRAGPPGAAEADW